MFLNYINNFRGIAIIYIVAGHCISAFQWDNADSLQKMLKIIFSNGTVLFVFIAGYLFQHLSGSYNYKRYINKKILYVILPYVICSIPAIIYFTAFVQRWDLPSHFYEQNIIFQILSFYLSGKHLAPYWFIPMISIYYLISYVLYYLDGNQRLYYSIPLLIIMSSMVSKGGIVDSFFHFFSVYVIGMCFSRYKNAINPFLSKYQILLINFLLVVVFIYLEYYEIYSSNYLQKIFLSLFYLSLLYKFDSFFKNSLSYVADISFAIYFVHSYIISGVKLLMLAMAGHYFSPSMISYAIFSCAIFLICTLMVTAMKSMLKQYSRYIIGS